jgi:hypothetical protein
VILRAVVEADQVAVRSLTTSTGLRGLRIKSANPPAKGSQ